MNLCEKINNLLNPAIWNSDNSLKTDVRDKIIEIVDYFCDNLTIPLSIVDILICGSNAAYTYTENSDLDVHIIANFDISEASAEILQALYNLEKTNFNKNYDISIHGIQVELYVLDANSSVISNGIYSVKENKWIKEPIQPDLDVEPNVEEDVDKWITNINIVLLSDSKEEVELVLNNLYALRLHGLSTEGEFSKGNIIFKQLRDKGYLDLLKRTIHKFNEEELTLENLLEMFLR